MKPFKLPEKKWPEKVERDAVDKLLDVSELPVERKYVILTTAFVSYFMDVYHVDRKEAMMRVADLCTIAEEAILENERGRK